MITVLIALLLAFADPFWVTAPAREWTPEQINELLHDSPWAKLVPGPGRLDNLPAIHVQMATAAPIRQAEEELARRAEIRRLPDAEAPPEDPFADEYRQWLAEFSPTQIVLAIEVADTVVYADAAEIDRLENESVMRVGRRKIPMTGYFPPTVRDPFLRIAFPREVALSDGQVRFELYIPGVAAPYRDVEFQLKDMLLNGKLEL